MKKQQKSNNSSNAKKPFASRQMLRLALVAGVVGGFTGPAFAQTELTLPAFPAAASLPDSQATFLPTALVEVNHASPSTSQRVAMLLGLKKVALNILPAQPSPTIALPSFPSTEPIAPEQPYATVQATTKAPVPTIFRSTSGKTDSSNTVPYTTSIVLASADESLSEIEIPPTLTEPAFAGEEELTETESLDISLADLKQTNEIESDDAMVSEQSEASTETLLDIEVPKSLVQLPQNAVLPLPTLADDQPSSSSSQSGPLSSVGLAQLSPIQTEQAVPEVVRRSPAIQLHIGGGMGVQSSFSDNEQPEEQEQTAPANFSMSDADDNAPEEAVATGPKTLKVRIEGEPAQVVSRSIASTDVSEAPQKKLSFDPASFSMAPANTGTQRNGIQSLGEQMSSSRSASAPVESGPVGGLVASLPNLSSPGPVSKAGATQRVVKPNNDSKALDIPALIGQGPAQVAPTNTGTTITGTTITGTEVKPTIGTRVEVGLHESSSVDTSQPISGLSVEHPDLCQVLKSSERSFSLVGLKAGQTRIALFTTSASGERKIEIREVLIAGTENRQADMNSMAAEISKSVRRMYPSSRIEVIAEDDGLAVQGYAGSEAEAKKIISLIRRTSLQPVIDRLATYK